MLRVRLFGRFRASADAGPVAALERRKVQELLGYLLLSWRRPARREVLAEQLWAASDPLRCRKYLRQSLWRLRGVLDASGCRDVLHADQEWIELRPDASLWVDTLEVERVYERCAAAPGREPGPDLVAAAERAVELCHAQLLDGWYTDWSLLAREQYRAMHLALLDRLMAAAEQAGRWEAGLAYGRRALREDPAGERVHVRMMRLHLLSGDRSAALRQFGLCSAALERELGVAPAPETRRLFELIRDGRQVGGAGLLATSAWTPDRALAHLAGAGNGR
jgi:DNA-binding SARP family transcriptional activator